MKKSVIAIIQARMGSSRLPGKCLMPLHNSKSALQLMLERVAMAQTIDRVVVATSTESQDDAIEEFCQKHDFLCFRGNENDVLDRFYQAATHFQPAEVIVRLTADCPLHDPAVLDSVIQFFLDENLDYGSNVDPPTFPDGLDTEVFTYAALETSWKMAAKQEEREHVTTFIKRNLEMFNQKSLSNDSDLSSHHWTLDDENDLTFIKHIYDVLYDEKPNFTMHDILDYLAKNPDAQSLTDGWTHLIR